MDNKVLRISRGSRGKTGSVSPLAMSKNRLQRTLSGTDDDNNNSNNSLMSSEGSGSESNCDTPKVRRKNSLREKNYFFPIVTSDSDSVEIYKKNNDSPLEQEVSLLESEYRSRPKNVGDYFTSSDKRRKNLEELQNKLKVEQEKKALEEKERKKQALNPVNIFLSDDEDKKNKSDSDSEDSYWDSWDTEVADPMFQIHPTTIPIPSSVKTQDEAFSVLCKRREECLAILSENIEGLLSEKFTKILKDPNSQILPDEQMSKQLAFSENNLAVAAENVDDELKSLWEHMEEKKILTFDLAAEFNGCSSVLEYAQGQYDLVREVLQNAFVRAISKTMSSMKEEFFKTTSTDAVKDLKKDFEKRLKKFEENSNSNSNTQMRNQFVVMRSRQEKFVKTKLEKVQAEMSSILRITWNEMAKKGILSVKDQESACASVLKETFNAHDGKVAEDTLRKAYLSAALEIMFEKRDVRFGEIYQKKFEDVLNEYSLQLAELSQEAGIVEFEFYKMKDRRIEELLPDVIGQGNQALEKAWMLMCKCGILALADQQAVYGDGMKTLEYAKNQNTKDAGRLLEMVFASVMKEKFSLRLTLDKKGKPQYFEYEEEKFYINKELGKGGLGVVHLYCNSDDGDLSDSDAEEAMRNAKKIAVKSPFDFLQHEEIVNEVEGYLKVQGSTFNSKNGMSIVKLLGIIIDDNGKLHLAMEYAPNKDVNTISSKIESLKKSYGAFRTPQANEAFDAVIAVLLKEMLEATSAMHVKGLVHRDLKPDNCLVDGKGKVVLGDFSAVVGPEKKKFNRFDPFMGTTHFALAGDCYVGLQESERAKRDVFALGMSFWEVAKQAASKKLRSQLRPLIYKMTEEPFGEVSEDLHAPKGARVKSTGRYTSAQEALGSKEAEVLYEKSKAFESSEKLEELRKQFIEVIAVSDIKDSAALDRIFSALEIFFKELEQYL